MSNREDLEELRNFMESSAWIYGTALLARQIDQALATSAPEGDPETLRDLASGFRLAAGQADRVHFDVQQVADGDIPRVWEGTASQYASEVVAAVSSELELVVSVFGDAGMELDTLADGLQSAQHTDAAGRQPLHRARSELESLPPLSFDSHEAIGRVREIALEGVRQLLAAAITAEDAARVAQRQLNDLAAQARAGSMDTEHLGDADKLVLAQAAVPGGSPGTNSILSETDAERAAEQLDRMSAPDRERFDALLDAARSPQERAYLMKALAADHGIGEIEEFARDIHPHGDDPEWLRDHLTPAWNRDQDTTPGSTTPMMHEGREWTQGPFPTCVAASTVTARAMVDPLYALQLTTGGRPGDPAHDNPQAFAERLRDEQVRVYDGARPASADWPIFGYDGMKPGQGEQVANEEIGPRTGDRYEHRGLDSAAERREILPDVERAVDEGRPVPVQVRGEDGGHQMMIIGHEDGRLQLYNPWGYTVWVSEDDFVNGHMDKAAEDLPDVTGVHLPR